MFSRVVVGWQVSTSLRTELALDALDMGLWNRHRAGQDVIRAVFVTAGMPDAMWEKRSGPEISKAKVSRAVLNDLQALGERGDQVQRRIVQELCLMSRPHPEAPDQAKGRAALDDLRREAKAAALVADPAAKAADARRAAATQRAATQQQRITKLGALRDKFFELLKERPRTKAELQSRGYAFEGVLADLFEVYDIAYRRSYKLPHEQVDGSFHYRGFTYIVEAKWEKYPPDFGDLAKFKANVDGKLESTRGLFVAMAGFDDNSLEHLLNVTRSSRNNLVLVDGQDLIAIFDGRIALLDALTEKIDAAEQEGLAWRPLGR